MGKWISVEDKLPARSCKVVCFGVRGVGVANFMYGLVDGDFWFQCAESGDNEGMSGFCGLKFNVTHWMPLPEPPEAE